MSHQEKKEKVGKSGVVGGKMERKLSDMNTRAVLGGMKELIVEFKMVVDDVIIIER
jgi:hypothetical protein